MGARKRRAADRAGRPAMRSPGRPPVGRREHRQRFWMAIARGLSSENAGVAAGVSPAVGTRWFREGGGMPTLSRAPLSGRYLSFAEREELAILRAQAVGVRETARRLGRSPSTVSRELRRNAATRGGRLGYRATTAPWPPDRRAARTQGRGKQFVSPEIMISQRPAEVADRAVPGHWEGDLILGLGSSAIGTLVERTSRFTMLLHLPRMDGHGDQPRAHNGPALAGHGAEAVRDAIAAVIMTLPDQLRRSLTWDQGAEMAQHAQLRIDTGLAITS